MMECQEGDRMTICQLVASYGRYHHNRVNHITSPSTNRNTTGEAKWKYA